MNSYKSRLVEEKIKFWLDQKVFLQIVGPKWCGKTTTTQLFCKSSINLQKEKDLSIINKKTDINYAELLLGEKPRLIDEWQEYKLIWNFVKSEVDKLNYDKVQYILTGSTTPVDWKSLDSAAGRVITIKMNTMSLQETGESTGEISLHDMLKKDHKVNVTKERKDLIKDFDDLIYYICRGGWPTAILSNKRAAALEIPKSYLDQFFEVDLIKYNKNFNPDIARFILYSYARNVSTIAGEKYKTTRVSVPAVLSDVRKRYTKLSDKKIREYIHAFKHLNVIYEIKPWSNNLRSVSKIQNGVKSMFFDPSLACALLGGTPENMRDDLNTLGFLYENFVAHELSCYLDDNEKIEHYRDRVGIEVDFVITFKNGEYGLVQAKLGTNNLEEAIKSMYKVYDMIVEKNKKIKKEYLKIKLPSFMLIVAGVHRQAFTSYRTGRCPIHIVPIQCLKK